MKKASFAVKSVLVEWFQDRELVYYSPKKGRRVIRLSAKKQIAAAAAGLGLLGYSAAMTGVAIAAPVTGNSMQASAEELAEVRRKVTELQNDVAMKAAILRERQDLLAELIGEVDTGEAAAETLAADSDETAAADVMAPLSALEARQLALVERVAAAAEAEVAGRRAQLKGMGLPRAHFAPEVHLAMGGPDEENDVIEAEGGPVSGADPRFKQLFLTWKKIDLLEKAIATVPSHRPVKNFTYTSGFGVRFDPFRHTTAMHSGVDMAGQAGEPILAGGEGVVVKAGWSGGYGRMIEIDHGKGLTTRYGHLSRIGVNVGDRVDAGEPIGRMGSTGRSTGPHLHYEVRLDGEAVNPMPFLETAQVALVESEGARGGRGQ